MECTPPYTMNGFNIILLTLDRLVQEGSLIIYRAAGCKLPFRNRIQSLKQSGT